MTKATGHKGSTDDLQVTYKCPSVFINVEQKVCFKIAPKRING